MTYRRRWRWRKDALVVAIQIRRVQVQIRKVGGAEHSQRRLGSRPVRLARELVRHAPQHFVLRAPKLRAHVEAKPRVSTFLSDRVDKHAEDREADCVIAVVLEIACLQVAQVLDGGRRAVVADDIRLAGHDGAGQADRIPRALRPVTPARDLPDLHLGAAEVDVEARRVVDLDVSIRCARALQVLGDEECVRVGHRDLVRLVAHHLSARRRVSGHGSVWV